MYEAFNFFLNFKDIPRQFKKNFKILKIQNIIKFNILKLIYLYHNDQLPLKIKNIFIRNESVNPYIPEVGSCLSNIRLIQLIMI